MEVAVLFTELAVFLFVSTYVLIRGNYELSAALKSSKTVINEEDHGRDNIRYRA